MQLMGFKSRHGNTGVEPATSTPAVVNLRFELAASAIKMQLSPPRYLWLGKLGGFNQLARECPSVWPHPGSFLKGACRRPEITTFRGV